ncbi:hypothetical protein [Nocardioides soli]|uniref:MarR family transcriptional regulator n=1 Tax=Nocardioides soli TaxID=1036020 RepID=A0A7W4YZN9_9ACTN|nr:hypothetical protein [Nocardioides soli]MBB3041147.1 hypothetical protein [Nocardioides soli]
MTSVLDRQVANGQLPAWARIWAWTLANANTHGHAPAYPGQIRRDLDITTRDVSRAIRLARERRVIDRCSTAACLVLPGHALAPCEANHREGL